MDNKGFTLIEVIAIMVILAGIFLVSFPVLSSMSKSEEDNKFNNMKKDLCIAGKTYIYSNIDDFPNLSIVGSQIEFKVDELMLYGNVDEKLLNPKTNTSVKNDTLKYIVLDDLSLECEYLEE